MVLLPETVKLVAQTLEPHHLAYYAQDLAGAFHIFYTKCRVVSEDEYLSKARLKLIKAAKITFNRVLSLMGMSVPDAM
jgi:arginyl-tRNA synthetase